MSKIYIECSEDNEAYEIIQRITKSFFVSKELEKNMIDVAKEKYVYILDVTPKQNTVNRGKLTDTQKQEIRTKYKDGARPSELAKEYNVSASTIYKLIKDINNPYRKENNLCSENKLLMYGYSIVQ